MAVSQKYNKPVLPRTSDGSDLGSNRASIYSGKGLSFDGVNDRVLLGTQSSINEEGFTISLYAKLDDDTEHYIFTTGYTTTNSILLFSPSSSNEVRLSWYDGSTAPNTGGITYVNGEWFHVTVTYDGSTIKIFKNGEEVISQSYAISAIDSGLYELGWATARNKSTAYLQGDLSDFKAFNTTLTPAQVKELYDNPEQTLPTGVDATSLVLHLPMTEGAGSVLYNANANAIGTELISNAGFDETCQKWGTTDSSTVEISGGKAIWTNAPLSGSFVEQPLDLEVGKFYRVSFDYTSTAFNLFVNLGDTQQAVPLGNGRFTYDMYYGTGTSSLKFKHGYTSDSSASVDNVSVKEIVPNYYNGTINGATWVSGLPEPLPQTALMDWNKYDRKPAISSSNYYSATVNVPGNAGTIVMRHVGEGVDYSDYLYSLGTNAYGTQRALRNTSSVYGFVGYGSGNEDFTTSASFDRYQKTDISISWDETKYVNVVKNGVFIQSVYKSGLQNLSGSRDLRLYRSLWTDGSPQTIIFWAYYNRVLTTEEINDIYTGAVEPEAVADLEWYFTKENGYSYNGVTLTKNGSFDETLSSEGSTAGKDVFGNTITNPRASGAYNFDGASYVQGLNTGYLPTGDEARSLELWVYHRPIPGAVASQSLMEIGSGAGSNQRFGIMVTSPADTLYIVGQANDNSFGGFSIPENEWTHIVATHDGTTLNVYRNGSLAGTVSETYATIDVGYRIGLENRTTSPTSISGSYEWTRSQIANPRIYNYALTAEQVADNFNEKASTFGGTKVASELDAYIERTASDGATVEAHSCLVNYLTELDKK